MTDTGDRKGSVPEPERVPDPERVPEPARSSRGEWVALFIALIVLYVAVLLWLAALLAFQASFSGSGVTVASLLVQPPTLVGIFLILWFVLSLLTTRRRSHWARAGMLGVGLGAVLSVVCLGLII